MRKKTGVINYHLVVGSFQHYINIDIRGVSRIFERGGGGPISLGSWFPKKRSSSDFKRGGGLSNGLMGGGGSTTLVSLGRQILHI